MGFLDRLLSKPAPKVEKADAWSNVYTGFGTSRDKAIATYFQQNIPLTTFELDALYYGSDIAAKIVEFRPTEMFRRGYELRMDAQGDTSICDELESAAREMDLDSRLLDACIWGRLYGGCLVILGLNDGQEVFQPLNEDGVRSFDYIHVVDRRFATALTYYSDPMNPKFGLPETYQVGDPNFGSYATIHESRCLRFEGVRVDARRRRSNQGWGDSVLQRPYESLRDFSVAFQAVGNMMSDASQGVFKMKGLIDAISSGQKELVQARMQLVDMSRGVARSVLLDAESGEEFTKIATQFGGVSDLLDRYMLRLASASDMPVTVLMGRSPAGQNATGESDFRAFYATVESDQVNALQPVLMRVYKMLARAMGKDCEGLDFQFKPLWSPTDQEQAALELVVAQKDAIYVDKGVLHPSEVALSRYRAGVFGQSTEIDVESREAELEMDIKASLNPPKEPLMDPTMDPAMNSEHEKANDGDIPTDQEKADPPEAPTEE